MRVATLAQSYLLTSIVGTAVASSCNRNGLFSFLIDIQCNVPCCLHTKPTRTQSLWGKNEKQYMMGEDKKKKEMHPRFLPGPKACVVFNIILLVLLEDKKTQRNERRKIRNIERRLRTCGHFWTYYVIILPLPLYSPIFPCSHLNGNAILITLWLIWTLLHPVFHAFRCILFR